MKNEYMKRITYQDRKHTLLLATNVPFFLFWLTHNALCRSLHGALRCDQSACFSSDFASTTGAAYRAIVS